MASYPHLIEVGVMGHCVHGETGLCVKAGIECYQSGLKIKRPNMTVENFEKSVTESEGLIDQSQKYSVDKRQRYLRCMG